VAPAAAARHHCQPQIRVFQIRLVIDIEVLDGGDRGGSDCAGAVPSVAVRTEVCALEDLSVPTGWVLPDYCSAAGGLPVAGGVRGQLLALPALLREQRQHSVEFRAFVQCEEVGRHQRADPGHSPAPARTLPLLRLPHLLRPRHAQMYVTLTQKTCPSLRPSSTTSTAGAFRR